MRSTATTSIPTRSSGGGESGTLGDQIGEVLDAEQVDHTLGRQGAQQRGGIDLRHDRLQVGEARLGDDLALIAELVVGEAALDVLGEIGGVDLHAGAALDSEQHVEQVDRLRAELVGQRGVGRCLVGLERECLAHGFTDGEVDVGLVHRVLLRGWSGERVKTAALDTQAARKRPAWNSSGVARRLTARSSTWPTTITWSPAPWMPASRHSRCDAPPRIGAPVAPRRCSMPANIALPRSLLAKRRPSSS